VESQVNLIGSILVDSLAYGMILFIISVGLSITMGVMRFVNLAHGVFAVAGGYGVIWWSRQFGFPFELAVVASISVIAVLSAPLEILLFQRMYRRSELDQVLFSIGLVFVAIALLGMAFDNGLMSIKLPVYLTGGIDLGFRVVPAQRILAIAIGLLSMGLLWLLFNKTRFGIETRATVDNTKAARALGIRTSRVYCYAFALGAAFAALGGIMGAELLPIEPYYPLKYLVLFLAVVAVGGSGNPIGLMVAALLLGTVETAAKYFVPELSSILFYLTMLVVLSVKPAGLFGRES
jgi:branched-chain amino acid transport system permease protein